MFVETRARSLAKAVSWRLTGTAATTALVFLFTRDAAVSFSVGGLEFVAKVLIYYLHERVWDRARFGRRQATPAVLWFTGLSGSGKSTLAKAACEALRKRGVRVEYLDGDAVRELFPGTGFSRQERDLHVRRVGHLAGTLEKNGVTVVASLISPYRESRDFVRRLCRNFVEVHVSTPLEACERRDAKGLYARARRGEIRNFTGIDDPYEPPERPELDVDTSKVPESEALARVLGLVEKRVFG